jgi:CDP-glucose 4,6-dehydratase
MEDMVIKNFFRNKTILVTGHTGFKGSWLSLWLQQLGAKVVGYSLEPPTQPNLFTLANVADGMKSIIGDIIDFKSLLHVIETHKPEIVFHLAAQPLVLYSYNEPIETYATNVLGTVNVFEAIRQVACTKTIVNITTDKCYENKEWHWGYREQDTLGGHDPYSNSKACAELVTSAYRNSYFKKMNIGLASARAGNVIGGGDWAEKRLVPDIIQACMNHQSVCIRNPYALRPWQHVLEPLSGYLLLAKNLHEKPEQFAEGWNFGPNDDDIKPVEWIADYITKQWSKQASWYIDKQSEKLHEATFLKLDCGKAKSILNWKPRWDLSMGLNKTIEWYQAYQDKQNMREVTLGQIKNYLDEA